MSDDVQHVTGIGGVYLYAKDAEALAQWYAEHLHLDTMPSEDGKSYVTEFVALDEIEPSRRVTTVFTIVQADGALPPGPRGVRVSYRVHDLRLLLTRLKKHKVTVHRTEDRDDGSYAWIADAEGNEVELWQCS